MRNKRNMKQETSCKGFVTMLGIMILATMVGWLFYLMEFREENIIIVYLLGVLVTAAVTASRLWSVLSSLLSVMLFNFLFTIPRFSFTAYGTDYPITFFIAFLAAVIASNLAIQLRRQAEQSDQMAQRSKILLETNQILQKAKNRDEIIKEMVRQLEKLTGRSIVA